MRCTRLATITTLAFLVALPAVGAPEDEPMTTAWFEGRLIDLAEDWEEAQACLVSDVSESAECFRTEEELDSRMATVEIAWSSVIMPARTSESPAPASDSLELSFGRRRSASTTSTRLDASAAAIARFQVTVLLPSDSSAEVTMTVFTRPPTLR